MNVHGELVAHTVAGDEYRREIIAGTIAPGDLFDSRIVPDPGVPAWAGVAGSLSYGDLAGGRYVVQFQFSHTEGNELSVSVSETEHKPAIEAPPS